MLIQESRTYQLAKAALLAVLIAVTPVTAVLRAQNKPLPTAEKQEDPLNVLYKAAEKALDEKKYKEALDLFQELEDKAGDVANSMKAVLSFRKATCLFFLKDWPKAQVELTAFLDKYPKGTEDFFDGDNRRGTAELILIEAFSKQGKWDQAPARLDDRFDKAGGGLRRQQHMPTLRRDGAGVGGKPAARDLARDVEAQQPIAREVDRHRLRPRDGDAAHPRADRAAIRGDRPNECGQALVAERDGAVVLHPRAGARGAVEGHAAGHEGLVRGVGGGGDQPRHIHLRALVENDAGRIDDRDPAIGGQPPGDGGRIGAGHALQRPGGGVGLADIHMMVRADVEAAPFDHRALAGLLDLGALRRLGDAGLAGDNRPTLRPRIRRLGQGGQGDCGQGQGGAGQQQGAKGETHSV